MIKKIVVGGMETNCYLVYDEKSKEGMIIDPGAESERIIDEINKLNLKILYIIVTHGHGDHIGALDELKKSTNARVLINQDDLPWFNLFSVTSADGYLKENQVINLGSLKLKVLHTPGHSEGSISLLGEDFIFTGDTLFSGAVGRVDLPGGDEKKLFSSIREKIFTLPEKTVFYPGHGDGCTIGEAKKHNPFL